LPALVAVSSGGIITGANYSWYGTDNPQVFTMHNPIFEWWEVDYAGVSAGTVRFLRLIINLHTTPYASLTSSSWNATIYWKASVENL